MSTAVATPPRQSLVVKFADRYSVDPTKLMTTLKNTAFRQRGDQEVTDEQMMALLVVADQYGLNPFTGEIFAFNDKGAIKPMVSVDGWLRIINEHPQFDGMEFHYAEEWETPIRGRNTYAWIECVIYRKDRSRPTIIREYIDECYQGPRGNGNGFDGPWQTTTKRMLRHRSIIQCGRVAFGFAGLHDVDEQQRIIDMGAADEVPSAVVQPQSRSERQQAAVQQGDQRSAAQRADSDGVIAERPAAQQPDNPGVAPLGQGRARRAAAQQAQATPATTVQREPGSDDEEAPPASESAMRILKTKLENAALGEADVRKRFGFGYEGVTTANLNAVLTWSEDPTGA